LFRHMLQQHSAHPSKLAYDRPSPKLIAFLRKYYNLTDFEKQNNNYVVFNQYFSGASESPRKAGARESLSQRPLTARDRFGRKIRKKGQRQQPTANQTQSSVGALPGIFSTDARRANINTNPFQQPQVSSTNHAAQSPTGLTAVQSAALRSDIRKQQMRQHISPKNRRLVPDQNTFGSDPLLTVGNRNLPSLNAGAMLAKPPGLGLTGSPAPNTYGTGGRAPGFGTSIGTSAQENIQDLLRAARRENLNGVNLQRKPVPSKLSGQASHLQRDAEIDRLLGRLSQVSKSA